MRGYMNGGLDSRYKILDAETGEQLDGSHRFVLNFGYDKHARKALLVYADSVRSENPALAADIESQIVKHEVPDGYEINIGIEDVREALLGKSPVELVADAIEGERESYRCRDCETPTPILDADGNVLAGVIREFDAGHSPNHSLEYHDPGEQGYDYWRFATVAEMREAGLLGDGS